MTWSPENKTTSIVDALEGTITEWYDACDELLKASEFIPGNYEYSTNIAYANSGEFEEGGQTHVDVSCDRFKIISVDNSYINLEMEFPIHVPNTTASDGAHTLIEPKAWYIGFKKAFDVIDQYRIYSNSDLIVTQNHSNYESWLQYITVSDSAKQNSELYATWDKIQRMDEDVPGVYIDVKSAKNKDIVVPINLRVPIKDFMVLTNLKYYPGFFGKFTIELYPSYKNLVICPVLPDFDNESAADSALVKRSTLASFMNTNRGFNPFGFSQINGVSYVIENKTADHTKTLREQYFKCSTSTTKKCHLRLAEAVVRMDVYNELLSRFVNKPLLFPIQSITSKDFSGAMPQNAGDNISLAQTTALNHCNSMFIVFKKTNQDRTCFENPMIKWQVNIEGKYFPREEYKSYNDSRNMNLFLDATNFNGTSAFSIPNDVYHSLQPFVIKRTYTANGYGTENEYALPKDRSNFAIAIPFCDDDTFQAGLHSGGTVQVELRGSASNDYFTGIKNVLPTALYIEDSILKLRSVKPAGSPQISITNATTEQILSSAVIAN